MEYEVFTSNLSNLKKIRLSIEKVRSKLEVAEYEETGVKGIDYTHAPTAYNPSLTALKRLELVDEVDELMRELNCLSMMANEIESLLDRMPEELKGMLTEKFIKGWTYEKVGEKYGYSHSGIQYRMRVETEKYL
jgi:DNA-directed RNA polymerase specialized sigma24 family protein